MCRIQSCRVVMNGGYAHVQWWSIMDMFMRRAGQWWICSCAVVVNGGICSCVVVVNAMLNTIICSSCQLFICSSA